MNLAVVQNSFLNLPGMNDGSDAPLRSFSFEVGRLCADLERHANLPLTSATQATIAVMPERKGLPMRLDERRSCARRRSRTPRQ